MRDDDAVEVPRDDPAQALHEGGAASERSDPALNSSFGRGKGMVFLVDVKSRQVIWSAYEPPKGSNLSAIDRSANDIVARLKKDLNLNPKAK